MDDVGFGKGDHDAFNANDRPGPVQMLNLVRLRKRVAYMDGSDNLEPKPLPAAAGRARRSRSVSAGGSSGAAVWGI